MVPPATGAPCRSDPPTPGNGRHTASSTCLTPRPSSNQISSETRVPSPCRFHSDSSCLLHGGRRDHMFRPSQSARGPRGQRRHPRPTTANRTSLPSLVLRPNLGMEAGPDCRRWQRRLRPRGRAQGVLLSRRMCGILHRWRLLLPLQSRNLGVLTSLLLGLQGTFSLPSMCLPPLPSYHISSGL